MAPRGEPEIPIPNSSSTSASDPPSPLKINSGDSANIVSRTDDENVAPTSTSTSTSETNVNHVIPETDVVPKTKICVFCGASQGNSPAHMEAARSLAKAFHEKNISLVYGGGTCGLMGEVARTLVSLSGPSAVHGIIPAPLIKYERGPDSTSTEITSGNIPALSEYGHTTVVKDMHTRKQLMAREVISGGPGSGFIALSGGYGTFEELMEVVTWNQLGIHDRGIVVLNIDSYWDGLFAWIASSVQAGFVGEKSRRIVREARTADEAVLTLESYENAEGRFKLSWGME